MKYRAAFSLTGVSLIFLTACGQNGDSGANEDGSWSPTGTVTVAVGAKPGGGSDIMGRAFASGIEGITGDTAVVENYDTVEGILVVKNEPGNAEIVGVGNYSNMVVRPNEQNVGYAWQDLTQLAVVAEDVSYVVAKTGAFDSAEAMIEAAKSGGLTVGQVGSGAADSLLTTQLEEAFGFSLQPVVYEGGGDVVRGVLAGDLDLAIMEPSEFLPQVEAGEMEVLLSTGSESSTDPGLADVPLASELGADRTFSTQWRVIFGAPNLDEAQQEYWLNTLEEWAGSASYDKYIADNDLLPVFLTGDDLTSFISESEQVLKEGMS